MKRASRNWPPVCTVCGGIGVWCDVDVDADVDCDGECAVQESEEEVADGAVVDATAKGRGTSRLEHVVGFGSLRRTASRGALTFFA